MKRFFASVGIIAAVPVIAYAAGFHFVEYVCEDGGFSVLMPGEVERSIDTISTEMGYVIHQIFQSGNDHGSFTVGRSDMPWGDSEFTRSDVMEVLDGAVQGAREEFPDAEVIYNYDIVLDGNPGKAYRFTGTGDGLDLIMVGRMYMVGNVLYQILVCCEDRLIPFKVVWKFLDSFMLLEGFSG